MSGILVQHGMYEESSCWGFKIIHLTQIDIFQKSFWKCCPFNKEIRGEIVATLRKGTPEWFNALKSVVMPTEEFDNSFVDFCTEIYVNLEHGLSHYHPLFEG